MDNIYMELNKILEEGERLVLARIIKQAGSAPRTIGTKCIFREDGSIIGTIGGGSLEYQIQEEAKKTLKEGKSSIIHIELTGQEVAKSEMLCGGIVDVYLEPISPRNRIAKKVFQRTKEMTSESNKGLLLTLVSDGIGYKDEACRILIEKNGSSTGDIGTILDNEKRRWQNLLEASREGLIEWKDGEHLVFVEPIRPDDVLYLFGAGHISTVLAPLAKMVGFQVVVIDDRGEFANKDRFPDADEIIVCPFLEAFNHIPIDPSAYIAIITRGHIHDRVVLKGALMENPVYIGMIGSKRKRKIIYESLMEEGITNERLSQVHSPIGLDIGAETPGEIAVSIVAELIQARVYKGQERSRERV